MSNINQLASLDSPTASDLVPVWSQTNGDARKTSMANLALVISGLITTPDDKVTQYAQPSATGFNVQITDGSNSIFLILMPAAGYAAGTITLPALANCKDKQEVLVFTTQAITTLTVAPNGATVLGAPTTAAANDSFRLRFDKVLSTWYKIA